MPDRARGTAAAVRAQRWLLTAIRIVALAALIVGLYRLLLLLLVAPQNTLVNQSMFNNRTATWAAAYPLLLGAALLLASSRVARFIAPAPHGGSGGHDWMRAVVRAAAVVMIASGAWIALSRARAALNGWDTSGMLLQPRPTLPYRISKTLEPCGGGLALLVLGSTVLAAQRPLIRLLAPRVGGCPGCGYDMDESKQARCPECGLELQSTGKPA